MLQNTIKNSSELIKDQFLECQHLRNEIMKIKIKRRNQTFYSQKNKRKSIFENTKTKLIFQKSLSQPKEYNQFDPDPIKANKPSVSSQSYRVRPSHYKIKSVDKIRIRSYSQQKQVYQKPLICLNIHNHINKIGNNENTSKVIHSRRSTKRQLPIRNIKNDSKFYYQGTRTQFQQQQNIFGHTIYFQREEQKKKIQFLIRQFNQKSIIKDQVQKNKIKIKFSNHKTAPKQKYLECRPWSPVSRNEQNLSQLQCIIYLSSHTDQN